ncbi:hypothetical protein P3T42_004541 [Paraburkholderia sp. GAS38]|uniref:hypothetical protein n=1 Tax=Paraburkholderia sp. GAS38 TaxID=3035133 RepID=UPI003D261644
MDLTSLAASAAIAASAVSPASFPAPVAQPAPLTQADAPAYVTGETWTFQYRNDLEPAKNSTYTQTVARVEDGRAIVNGGATILDANGNIVKLGTASYEPSDGKLRFPLRVGDEWTSSYAYHSGSWEAIGQRQTKVVGVERVDTAAGSFEALRVEQLVSWSAGGGNKGGGRTSETDWYAPSVGRIVKADFSDKAAGVAPTSTHVELVKFSRP